MLSWVLALTLSFSLLPASAFASDASHEATIGESRQEATELLAENPKAPAAEPPAPAAEPTAPAAKSPVEEPKAPAAEPIIDPTLDEITPIEPQFQPFASSSLSFDDTYCANIATSPTYASATGGAAGFQYAGTTLYAIAFKATSKTAIARTRVADDGTLAYTWYASTTKSQRSLSDTDIIPGETRSSITLTNEMAGKYLFVKITATDGTTALGPRTGGKPNGMLSGVGQIKAAVPDKTALDDHSYILVQPSSDASSHLDKVEAAPLSAGTTLYANAYDGEASPNRRMADQPSWQYQWLCASEREVPDSAFEPIEGATQKSLPITESLASQLAGKYIRVQVTGDGYELYGPSSTFNAPASVTYNTPGPVKAKGQIVIDHVVLAFGNAPFGDDYESVPDAHVGDTLRAAAYDSSLPDELYAGDKVDFQWQIASEATGPFETVATGDSFMVGDYAGKYLRVVATARNGVPGCEQHATEAGRILAQGVYTLSDVRILNASSVKETRGHLTALAYEGDCWSSTPVPDGVTYTWRWSAFRPNYWGEAEWHDIPGISGATFTVPDEFEGLWVSVSAYAGDNVIESQDYAGPFARAEGPEDPIDPDDPSVVLSKASVKVTGIAAHKRGEAPLSEVWVPLGDFAWPEGKRVTAWDAFQALLSDGGFYYDTKGGYPYSITSPDGKRTLAMSANAPWSYWAFFVNGVYADTLTCSYALEPGDLIELRYIEEGVPGASDPAAIETFPYEKTPDVSCEWEGFSSGAPSSADLPSAHMAAQWTFVPEQAGHSATWSEPILVDGKAFMVSGTSLLALDQETGTVLATVPLAASVNKGGCRPVYAAGKVIVPLSDGRLQAISATTLHCLWVSDALPEGAITHTVARPSGGQGTVSYSSPQQSLSSLFVRGGFVYAATAVADAEATYGGYLACFDVSTGALAWKRQNAASGYYWAGAAELNGFVLIGGDDGMLEAIPADSPAGEPTATLSLGAAMRSTVVVSDGYAYCVTRDGVLHQIAMGADGPLQEVANVKFAASSTSTPTIVQGMAYVGGALPSGAGIIAEIDTATMACRTVSMANGSRLPGEVKSKPLVSKQAGGTYIYFTCNHGDSAVYVWKAGERAAEVAFKPAASLADYCLSSIVSDSRGRLYYANDKGCLFALKADDRPDGPWAELPAGPEMPAQGQSGQLSAPSRFSSFVSRSGLLAAAASQQGIVQAAMGDAEREAEMLLQNEADAIADDAVPLAGTTTGADSSDAQTGLLAWVLLAGGIVGLGVAAFLLVGSKRRTRD